jgi:hypothetical protein
MHFKTHSGMLIDPLNPRVEDINILDIQHGLSRICRYAGQFAFYSVAQHSLLISKLIEDRGESRSVQLYALLHDASEAYMGDVPSPFKAHCHFYTALEDRLMSVIIQKFAITIDPIEHALVHSIDKQVLKIELKQPAQSITQVEQQFRNRFEELFYDWES